MSDRETITDTAGPETRRQALFDLDTLGLGPPRGTRRRRQRDPITRVLMLILALTVAFYLGVRIGHRAGSSAAAPAPAPPAAGAGTNGAGAPAQPPGGTLTGRIKAIEGDTLYVVGPDGHVVKVTTKGSRVSTVTAATLRDLHPGDTVAVRGNREADGSVSAVSITGTGEGTGGGTATSPG